MKDNEGKKKDLDISLDELRQIQLAQLDILKEFDRICRKNDLQYTLCGGSLLGAVRHGGFIPWDDDIDVTMLREEYDRFCEICKKELDTERFFLQTMETDPEYRLIWGKILLKGTSYVRAGQEHVKCKNGIFIDIFPRDGRSDITFFGIVQSKIGWLMRKILYSPVGVVRSPKKVSRFGYRILSKIPRDMALRLMHLIQRLNFGKETELVGCYGLMGDKEKKRLELGKAGYKRYQNELRRQPKSERLERRERNRGLRRSFFKELIDMPFEDMQAKVTVCYDTWLKINYDDYMTLPPEDKRVIHQTVSYYSLGER